MGSIVPIRVIAPPPWMGPSIPAQGGSASAVTSARICTTGDAWYATPGPNGNRTGPRWATYADGSTRRDLVIAPEHRASGVRPIVVVLPGDMAPYCLHSPRLLTNNGWEVTGDLDDVLSLEVPEFTVEAFDFLDQRVVLWRGSIAGGQLRSS